MVKDELKDPFVDFILMDKLVIDEWKYIFYK